MLSLVGIKLSVWGFGGGGSGRRRFSWRALRVTDWLAAESEKNGSQRALRRVWSEVETVE